jgi:hypothetical protein
MSDRVPAQISPPAADVVYWWIMAHVPFTNPVL